METAAAILVNSMLDNSTVMQQQIVGLGVPNPESIAAFITPYWVEMMKSLKRAQQTNPGIR